MSRAAKATRHGAIPVLPRFWQPPALRMRFLSEDRDPPWPPGSDDRRPNWRSYASMRLNLRRLTPPRPGRTGPSPDDQAPRIPGIRDRPEMQSPIASFLVYQIRSRLGVYCRVLFGSQYLAGAVKRRQAVLGLLGLRGTWKTCRDFGKIQAGSDRIAIGLDHPGDAQQTIRRPGTVGIGGETFKPCRRCGPG